MFGCCNCLSNDISRIAVLGMPSSSASRRIFFSARISPVTRSLALYTCEMHHGMAVREYSVGVGKKMTIEEVAITSAKHAYHAIGAFTDLFDLLVLFHAVIGLCLGSHFCTKRPTYKLKAFIKRNSNARFSTSLPVGMWGKMFCGCGPDRSRVPDGGS